MELYSMLCTSLNGSGAWGRTDNCICTAEFLHHSPESITTLLIGYTPIKGASLMAQLIKNPRAVQETPDQFLVRKIPWRRNRLPTPVFLGFPCGSAGKESACSEGDLGLIPGMGRSPGEGNGYPLQYSGLENFMDCIVLGVTKSRT